MASFKTKIYETEEDWLQARLGLVTGTATNGMSPKRDGTYGKTFWEKLAERVCEQPDDENPMERGNRLEEEAIAELEKASGLEFDTRKILWVSKEIKGLALSPDGVGLTKTDTACEIKCLNSAHHLEAYYKKDYPKTSTLYQQYKAQARSYFHVNTELNTLYIGFYDPRAPIPFHYITMERKDIADELDVERGKIVAAIAELDKFEKDLIKF